MPWWLWLVGLGGAAVVLARRSAPSKVLLLWIPPAHAPTGEEHDRTIDIIDRWRCPRDPGEAAAIVPPVESIVPQEVLDAAGPIGVAIRGGLQALRAILEAIGKRTCTLDPGQYVVLDRVTAPQGATIRMSVELSWRGRPPAWRWAWAPVDVSATGPLPLPERQVQAPVGPDYDHPAIDYLGAGGEPRGTTWPHYPIDPDWVDPNPSGYAEPRADIVRTGDDLLLGVWLPARSGLYAAVTWARQGHRHRLVARPRWRIRWRWT